MRSISSRVAASTASSVGDWSGGDPVPGYSNGCSAEPSRSVTIGTTLDRGSGAASAATGAGAAENGVNAVLAVSTGAVATEYVVAVSVGPDVLSFWKAFSTRWVAVVTADATSPMVSASDPCVHASRCSCSLPSDPPNCRSPNPSRLLPAPAAHLYLGCRRRAMRGYCLRRDPGWIRLTERNTDLSDGRPEGDESSSSPSAEAASLSADLVVVDGDFFVDWSAASTGIRLSPTGPMGRRMRFRACSRWPPQRPASPPVLQPDRCASRNP